MPELQSAMKASTSKSAGPDNIPYEIIWHLSQEHMHTLLDYYNYLYDNGYPHQWREGNTIPICKPGKDPTAPSSYRPITLLNCLAKLMGKMVTKRLQQYLEELNFYSPYQSGFCSGFSHTPRTYCKKRSPIPRILCCGLPRHQQCIRLRMAPWSSHQTTSTWTDWKPGTLHPAVSPMAKNSSYFCHNQHLFLTTTCRGLTGLCYQPHPVHNHDEWHLRRHPTGSWHFSICRWRGNVVLVPLPGHSTSDHAESNW